MPLGWYLAQGLIPLGPSSSDDEEGPCELPNGRLVCGPHGRIVCGRCCTDYSFMEEVLGDDPSDDEWSDDNVSYEEEGDDDKDLVSNVASGRPYEFRSITAFDVPSVMSCDLPADIASSIPSEFLGPERKRGTGRVFPTKFHPSSPLIQPTELFRESHPPLPGQGQQRRWVHQADPLKALIFTDGACLNNGQPNPKAGWAFAFGPGSDPNKPQVVSRRLEKEGPFGDASVQSSNRAELRAVIGALRFRDWAGEGFRTVVIATDSEYTAEGCTKWIKTWIKKGWKTSTWADVKNRDLWEMLLGEVERYKQKGLDIHFWRIPREWNSIADAAAKKGADGGESAEKWMEVIGIMG